MKKIFIVLLASILSACGAKNSCDQKELIKDFSQTFENALNNANLGYIWSLHLDKNVKISLSDIKELSASENQKTRFCSANFTFEFPKLNGKLSMNQEGFFSGSPKTFIDAFVFGFKPEELSDINDAEQTFTSEIAYSVTEVIKSSNGRDSSIKFDFQKSPGFKKLVFKVAQVIGTEINREQPKTTDTLVWDKEKFEYLMKIFNEDTSLPKNQKEIHICTLKSLSLKTHLSSYASFMSLQEIIAGNLMATAGAYVDPKSKFVQFANLFSETRASCGDFDLRRQLDEKKAKASLDAQENPEKN
jgi:hypothetical protein